MARKTSYDITLLLGFSGQDSASQYGSMITLARPYVRRYIATCVNAFSPAVLSAVPQVVKVRFDATGGIRERADVTVRTNDYKRRGD